ncbi:MAG: TldD/PmbA family protein [Candidatus Bathyarchaeia archaeon]
MVDRLKRYVEQGLHLGAQYIDLRFESLSAESVSAEDGKPKEVGFSFETGIGVRALAGGAWGFSASRVDQNNRGETISQVVQAAVKLAVALKESQPVVLAPTKVITDTVVQAERISPYNISLDEKMKLCVESSAEALRADPAVKKSSAGLSFLTIDKTFVSSEGADIRQVDKVVFGGVFAQAFKGGVAEYYSDTFGGMGGYEFVKEYDLVSHGKIVGQKAALLAGAKPTPTGETTVVLDPEFCSLLCHEIVGHPSEADRVLGKEAAWAGRTWWKDKVGQRVFSEALTIVSDATLEGYFGSFKYDDEGVPSKRIVHVEKGVLRDFLHSRESAAKFGIQPNGAMRASSYLFAPLIRMTNTYIEKGDWEVEEIIQETRDGIYLKGDKIPSIDSRRYNFQISAKEAYAIRKGELCELLRSPTLTGVSPRFLSTIDAVAKDLQIFPIPNCGKGEPMQTMRVGNGGPHIRGFCMVTGPR